MSIRFIHTADVHIGMSFKSASFGTAVGQTRRAEIKETFFRILDECSENKVELLLIAGDLLEQDYVTVSDMKDLRNRFADMPNTHICIIAGNHDPIINERSMYSIMDWSENVHIFDTLMEKYSIEALDIDVYGFSWSTKEIREYGFDFLEISDQDKTNILMLHGDADNYQSEYLPLNMTDLFGKGFDYIALGHIHKPDGTQHRWAYPGSPEPLDFSEKGPHGIIEGIIDEGNVSFQFRSFSKREFVEKNYTVDENMSFEEIKNLIIRDLENDVTPNNLYRINILGIRDIDVNIDLDIIKDAVMEIVFYGEVYDRTFENYDLDRIKKDNQGNIIETFINHMQEKGLEDPVVKDALYEGLHILLKEQVM